MTTTTLRDGGNAVAVHAVTSDFTDVVTSIPGASNTPGLLVNLENDVLVVVKGGSTAPVLTSRGENLGPGCAVFCDAANIWVRARDGSGTVCFQTL